MTSGRNRLDHESSPYLLQHAGNPVHWQPWDDAAIAEARESGKPILLSIGYSACHWCHVMAHESFEDETTAALMNEHFVNIKIDREERPDLDKIYQVAHHLLTQQTGGWPLTMFLDAQTLVPFFGGTYFPKTPRYQLPGFTDLLRRISQVYAQQHDELAAQGEKLADILGSLNPPRAEAEAKDEVLLQNARDTLGQQYDAQDGGFGGAPKFPMPVSLDRLLRHWAESLRRGDNDRDGLDMVMTTLTKIARGGIYDHLGGGFCRYSTDARWMIPHFEKMLYDNGALLALYSDALAVGADLLFEAAVRDTAQWLMRDMQHPDGGYFSALDADSEGEEGKYYVWRRDQVKRLLSEDEYLVVETLYGLDKPANFEGKWNLHRYDAWHAVADRLSLDRQKADTILASARVKLLSAREERIPPGKDDKVLTAWNGLAIKGMAKAGVLLGEPAWVDSATRAADFIRSEMFANGRLRATWRNGDAKYPAYLDDYANLLDGLLALLSARWRDEDATFAVALAEATLTHFEDRDAGGFFFTAHDHEQLIHRPKHTTDDALPPGNAILAHALTQLGHLFAAPRYLDAAHATLTWARAAMEQYPAGHCSLLAALEAEIYPGELVIIRGPQGQVSAWQDVATQGYKPWRQVYVIPYDAAEAPDYLPRLVSSEVRERPTAFVCEGLVCGQPIDRLDEFKERLGEGKVLAFPKR